jgi:hypothetical protein
MNHFYLLQTSLGNYGITTRFMLKVNVMHMALEVYNVIPSMALCTFDKSDHFSSSSIVVCNLVLASQTIMP